MAAFGKGRKRSPSFASSVAEECAKVSEIAVTSAGSKTFVFHDEDHTLGNALRHVLMRDPAVQFCGYSVPHPMEAKMHLRVQTTSPSVPAEDALRNGLTTLAAMCDAINEDFRDSVKGRMEE